MSLAFEVDPELDERLLAEIVACWTDVSNAGGAVGFIPPVTLDDVLPVAEQQLAGVRAGVDRLIVGRETDARDGHGPGRLVAVAFLVGNSFVLRAHWQTVKRVMVHPDCQGRGYGYSLMAEVAAVARESGTEQLSLDVRGGSGNDLFYKKCGYAEVGRLARGIKLPAQHRDEPTHSYRDLILMALEL